MSSVDKTVEMIRVMGEGRGDDVWWWLMGRLRMWKERWEDEWGEGDIFWKSGGGGGGSGEQTTREQPASGGATKTNVLVWRGWETQRYFGHRVGRSTACLLLPYGVPRARWPHSRAALELPGRSRRRSAWGGGW